MNAALRPPVMLYTEMSPNPNSMKFVVNRELVPEGLSFDYASPADALLDGKSSPLAVALFGFEFVNRVFIARNYVTLTKDEEADWGEILFDVKPFLKKYLDEDQPVFTQRTVEANSTVVEADSPVVQKIKAALDQFVRPAVESDGGAISFYSFDAETGLVKVLLQGSCSGCPSSTLTLKDGIQVLLTRMIPEVKTVEAQGV